MENKFTPGPWQVVENLDVRDEGHQFVARCKSADDAQIEVDKANARLIAAAPDLLTCLTTAMHALRSYENGNSSPDLAKSIADTCEALIAKVEG